MKVNLAELITLVTTVVGLLGHNGWQARKGNRKAEKQIGILQRIADTLEHHEERLDSLEADRERFWPRQPYTGPDRRSQPVSRPRLAVPRHPDPWY